jgi:hypothetical protein
MNLAQDFVLLAYSDDGTPETDTMRLDHGAGGALLLELALDERVDVQDKKVVVRDPAPTGDVQVDAALAEVAADTKPRKPDHWVQHFAKSARQQALDALVDRGVLQREKGKVLLIFSKTTYPAPYGVEPPAESATRARLRAAIAGTEPVEPRTAALCALIAATDLQKKVFADLDAKQVKARLKEIGEGSWAADAVKKTIEQIEAAVMASVIAATTASTVATVTTN